MENKEIWKQCTEVEEWEVSNLGRVRSKSRFVRNNMNGGKRFIKEHILKQRNNSRGYKQVTRVYRVDEPHSGGRIKTYLVHRLVAKAFIPNPDNLPCINHRDERKYNNCVDNLEWITVHDNLMWGTRGERQVRSNPLAKRIRCIETGRIYESQRSAGKDIGINYQYIGKILRNNDKLKTAGGYHWEYE